LERTFGLDSVENVDSDSDNGDTEASWEMESYEVVSLPLEPKVASTVLLINLYTAEVTRYFMENPTVPQVIGLDTEYHRGRFKADLSCLSQSNNIM
jgi:hypothetical protein